MSWCETAYTAGWAGSFLSCGQGRSTSGLRHTDRNDFRQADSSADRTPIADSGDSPHAIGGGSPESAMTTEIVRVVEVVDDRVLVEDTGDVDFDMITNYDMYLEFDDERTPRDFDDRGEDPDAYSVYDDHCDSDLSRSSGCVVDMCARSVTGLIDKSVKRSNVWLLVDCFCKHSLHA